MREKYTTTMPDLQEMHIAVLGMNGVGKSALTVKYITGRFITEYDANLEDTYCKHDMVADRPYIVWLMDTVEGVMSIVKALIVQSAKDPARYLSWADCFLVVYSITSAHSFKYAEQLLKQIAQHEHSLCVREHVKTLVANKMDMERYQQVSNGDGASMAESYGAEFFETCTTESYSLVKTVFHQTMARRARLTVVYRPSRTYSSDSDMQSAPTPPRARKESRATTGSTTPTARSFSVMRSSSRLGRKKNLKAPSLPPQGASSSLSVRCETPKKSSSGLKIFKLFQNMNSGNQSSGND